MKLTAEREAGNGWRPRLFCLPKGCRLFTADRNFSGRSREWKTAINPVTASTSWIGTPCETFKEDVDYIRKLISLRKAHPAFRLNSATDIQRHLECLTLNEHLIAYRLHDLGAFDNWEDIIVIHHASPESVEWKLPNDKTYQLLCNTSGFQHEQKEIKKAVAVNGIGTVILYLASDLKSFA